MKSYRIDYRTSSTALCLLGAKYDTDKSSQRSNVSDVRHCHPYTVLYHTMFDKIRHRPLTIGELGILHGSSLRMMREYFPHAERLVGLEYDTKLMNAFQSDADSLHIELRQADVGSPESLRDALGEETTFDIFVEDSTHRIDDQVRAVREVVKHLRPGGVLIVEDIFHRMPEEEYIVRLGPGILSEFADAFFVSLDHKNRCSTGWDNDKVLILTKPGPSLCFPVEKRLTIVTPCSRPENLAKLYASIDFAQVRLWIIVYDARRVSKNKLQFAGHPDILELWHGDPASSVGNAQRNHALDFLTRNRPETTLLHFLDDDNTMHPEFWTCFRLFMKDGFMYSFNRPDLRGNDIRVNHIDTAMVVVDFSLVPHRRWMPLHLYQADGVYFETLHMEHADRWIHIDAELCLYNTLR